MRNMLDNGKRLDNLIIYWRSYEPNGKGYYIDFDSIKIPRENVNVILNYDLECVIGNARLKKTEDRILADIFIKGEYLNKLNKNMFPSIQLYYKNNNISTHNEIIGSLACGVSINRGGNPKVLKNGR